MALDIRRRLEEELKQLDYEYRNELPKELQRAAALGDLRENGEYESARNRQDYLRLRIHAVRKRLGDLSMLDVDRLPRDRIGYGSKVELYDLDREIDVTYFIVMSEDADADAGRISTSSPIGKSLLNKTVGDEVTVTIPSGVRRFEVIGLKTIHELDTIETDAPA